MIEKDNCILQSVGTWLQWTNIKVSTEQGRSILNGINGVAIPGEVVALMGASGGGKTTLLNTLLHRNLRGLEISGNVLVNGRNIGKAITSVSAYVQQENLFVGTLTVKEHLNIQARLLMSKCSRRDRSDRVHEILKELGLEKCQNSLIGSPGVVKGISGGEMKRLALASILFSNPSIIFCDEPTTGLDSFMAYKTMFAIEELASKRRKTIICTIHQPSSETFELFDKVLFLVQGRVAFHGTPSEAVYFLSSAGYRMPMHVNLAEFFIETISIENSDSDRKRQLSMQISNEFQMSQFNNYLHNYTLKSNKKNPIYSSARGTISQIFFALCIRNFLALWRNRKFLWAKFVQKLFFGLFVGFLYRNTELNQAGIQSLRGILYFYITDLTYSTILGIIATMPVDFPLLFRDYHDGNYTVSLYMLSKVLALLPIYLNDCLLLVGISYFMIGLAPTFQKFLLTMITCMLTQQHVISLGVTIASLCSTPVIALTVVTPILTALSITGGLFSDVNYLPSYISWIQYLSWFRFGYESLIINDFTDISRNNISCALSAEILEENQAMLSCTSSGLQAIREEGFDVKNMYINWLFMILWSMANYAIAYIGLVFRTQLER